MFFVLRSCLVQNQITLVPQRAGISIFDPSSIPISVDSPLVRCIETDARQSCSRACGQHLPELCALCNVTKLGGWWNCTEAGWCRAAPDVAPPCLARPLGHLIVGIRIPSFARFKPGLLAYPYPCSIRESVILVIRSSALPCRARERAPSHSHGCSPSECESVSTGTIPLKAVFVASFLSPI